MTVQQKQSKQDQKPKPETPNLVRRYGQIGIAALAAALQFSNAPKKPTRVTRIDDRFVDHAV